MTFLHREVLDCDFYCPGNGEEEHLKSLEQSLVNLKPRGDLAAIRHWRSETLTAFFHRPEFTAQREHHAEVLTTHLTSLLAMFTPKTSTYELSASIRRHIIDLTLALAYKLHLSTHKYSFDWSTCENGNRTGSSASFRFRSLECMDLGGMKIEGGERLGKLTYLFDLCPAMMVRKLKESGNGWEEKMTLRKALVLVDAGKELLGTECEERSAKDESVVGWLEDHVAYPYLRPNRGRSY